MLINFFFSLANLPFVTGISAMNSKGLRRGAQGASCVAPGKLGLDACGERERVIALESW